MLEICKMLPALMRKFHMKLVNPEEDWQILDYTFLKPKAIDVWLIRRS